MKILYFTSTGNSLYVAKSLGGEVYSIAKMLKRGKLEFKDEKIGFVFPVYAWSVPPLVREFLQKATLECDYLFAVMTYGIFAGGAVAHLNKIAGQTKLNFSYLNKIKMVDNFLPGFDMSKQIKNEPKKQIEKHLAAIKAEIEASRNWLLKSSCLGKLGTKLMLKKASKPSQKGSLLGNSIGKGVKNFLMVEDSCTQCKVCATVCPLDNIQMDAKTGKISLGDRCTACFACVHNCPVNAIHLKGERSKARFRNSHIELKEIGAANSL